MGRFKVNAIAPRFRKLVSGMGWRLPGLLLLTAAILKLLNRNQPASDELAWLSGYVGVQFGSLAPQIEMAIGIWMLFRRSNRVKGAVAAAIFTLFVALNLHRATQGIQECSCFGGLSIPVAVTIVIDLVGIACGLLRAGLVRNVLPSGFWGTCRTNASAQKHVGKHDLGENHPVWASDGSVIGCFRDCHGCPEPTQLPGHVSSHRQSLLFWAGWDVCLLVTNVQGKETLFSKVHFSVM